MGKSSAARKGKRGAEEVIEKVRLKKQKKNEGKRQAIEKLKSDSKTHQKTIKKEKVSTKKQKKNDKPKSKKTEYDSEDSNERRKMSLYESCFIMPFRKFIAQAKAAEQACTNNPDDTLNLKKWAFALVEAALIPTTECKINELEFIRGALSKLEHVLKIDPRDHDAIFYLGFVHSLFMSYDDTVRVDGQDYIYHSTKAIECFEAFQDDEIYQAPEGHDVSRMRKEMQYCLRRCSSYRKELMKDFNTKCSDTKRSDTKRSDTEDYEIIQEERLWHEVHVARIENAKNQENVENLRSWAHAMIGLSYFTTDEEKEQKFYTEAIAKLEHAFKTNSNDKKLRLELLFARLKFGGNGEKEDDTLVEDYKNLYEELNPHLNEENSTSWTLTTCQRNRKAVSSEDNEKPEVGFEPDEYKNLYKELNPQLNDSESVELQTHPQDQSKMSKTLFVANLPYSVKQADIDNFFKDAGKVVGIQLSFYASGVFKGYGDVEFDTVEAAHKALELNGEQLMGRPLRIEIVKENIRGQCYFWGPGGLGWDEKHVVRRGIIGK